MRFPHNKPTTFKAVQDEDGYKWACMYYDLNGFMVWSQMKYPLAEILFEETLGTWA